ncbi:MAG TPA: TonB-dependent receptor, partial [Xanthomonadaceae bacterium]|nr:TonB-dependent receptor [Xanthomonadaceae bacterium]
VTFAVDGVPVLSDWFGYATVYFTPPAQQVARIDLIRGASGLLYGPQPGPVLNLIRRGPDIDSPAATRIDLLGFGNGGGSVYAESAFGGAGWGGFASAAHHRGDVDRINSNFEVSSGRLSALWQPDTHASWWVDVSAFRSGSDEPGRLTLAQFLNDPMQSTTPDNRIVIDRLDARLQHQRAIGEASQLTAKLFHWTQDRWSRRATNRAPGAPAPAFTTFDLQSFDVTGLDARMLTEWGNDHSLAWGTTLYTSNSPRTQSRSANLNAPGRDGETPRFVQDRENAYAAVFVENAFRIGDWTLVPGLRQERLVMRIEEPLKLASLRRGAINRSFGRTETLLGFGVTRLLGDEWRAYANVSQGYRPMRYDDIGNPTAELAGSNDPAPARALNHEIGLRGRFGTNGAVGLDVSLFRIDVEDRIEQRLVGASDVERINSGDARHEGLEFAVDWNLLAGAADGDALLLYANGSLLDARIVRSSIATLVGNRPQYAPERVLRAGLLWRSTAGHRLALTGTHISEQFWQDSNLGSGSGASLLPATMPSTTVWDIAAEWPLADGSTVLMAGVQNLGDRVYSTRIRTDGIEVAPRRQAYAGVRFGF